MATAKAVRVRTSSGWQDIALQGPQGPVGATGASGGQWFSGSGAPAGGLAGSAVGDWYLNTANGDVYEKTGASAWTLRDNLTGPQGATGTTGATGSTGSQGPAGTPGEQWFSQSGAPAGATGIIGDWSLDTATGDVYEKTGASTWTLRGNIKGPQGIQGIQGIPGAGAPDATTTAKGSIKLAGDLTGTADLPQIAADVIGDSELAPWAPYSLPRSDGGADDRTLATVPNDYSAGMKLRFRNLSALGITDTGTFASVVGYRAWSDQSGGAAVELAFTDSGNAWMRSGLTTTWSAWRLLGPSTPVGSPMAWLVSAIPTGYREFDGSAIVQATHPILYGLFGATIPDLRGKMLLGVDGSHAIGTTGGEFSHTLTVAEMPSHDHGATTGPQNSERSGNTLPNNYNTYAGIGGINAVDRWNLVAHSHSISAQGGGGAHNVTPPYRTVRWITVAG